MDKFADTYYTDQPIEPDPKNRQEPDNSLSHWDYVDFEEPEEIEFWNEDNSDKEVWGDVPERIKELLRMCRQTPRSQTLNKDFYQQTLFMADYEDDEEIVPFFHYYPVYHDMSVAQLRSYFSFRKLMRRGVYAEVSLSYIFVYIYEILMQIGVGNAEEGLEILEEIRAQYGKAEPRLEKYLAQWMRDYIAYYNLTEKTTAYFAKEIEEDARAAVLSNWAHESDQQLFDTVSSVAAYKIKNTASYKKHPDETTAITARVIRAVAPIYEQRYHQRLDELCFGIRKMSFHPMFASAVFHNTRTAEEEVFEISPRRFYYNKHGLWQLDTYKLIVFSKQGKVFDLLLHETDRRLRITLKAGGRIQAKIEDEEVETIIQHEIDTYLLELEEARRPKIKVDLSKLDQIRTDADRILGALLTEEEREVSTTIPKAEHPSSDGVPEKELLSPESEPSAPKNSPFTAEEQTFLRMLLEGADWQMYLRKIRIPAGVMTDNINEKMMDELQDIVVADNGDGLTVIDDYREAILQKI